MIYSNTLIFRGTYSDVYEVKDSLEALLKDKKQASLYNTTTSQMRKIKIVDFFEEQGYYILKINFNYTKSNFPDLLQSFQNFPVDVIHMCENAKHNVWIVNDNNYIIKYRLIPNFALQSIIFEYMKYKDSAIVLDNLSTIKFDQNSQQVVMNEKVLTHNELIRIVFDETIKGRKFFEILEQFIINFHNQCINQYGDLYAITKETTNDEEPSPFALFLVTFGIFAIIGVILKIMGYF